MASGSGSSNRKRKRVEDLKLGNSLIQVGDHDAGGGSKHRYEDPKRETDKKNMVEPPESTLENGVHEFSDFQNKHLGVTSHGHPLEHRGVDSSASKRISSLATKILAKAHQLDGSADDGIRSGGATRDQDAMTIIETLELGPKDHGCHSTEWEKVEPNSGIRLRSRTLEHEVVQAHLSQRYYLPPSLLYSVMRLSRDRQTFEVPVEGDWVTIAVVCHVKSDGLTKGRPEKQPEERRNEPEDTKEFDPNPRPPPPPRGRVFYNGTQTSNQPMENHGGSKHFASIKLCALPSRSKNGAIEQAGGDAMLNLMLFAADGEVKDPVTGQTVYRGGSGGAYEKYWKLTVGTVVGLVSPKLMKPYGVSPKNQSVMTFASTRMIPVLYAKSNTFCIGVIRAPRAQSLILFPNQSGSPRTRSAISSSLVTPWIYHIAPRRKKTARGVAIGWINESTRSASSIYRTLSSGQGEAGQSLLSGEFSTTSTNHLDFFRWFRGAFAEFNDDLTYVSLPSCSTLQHQ